MEITKKGFEELVDFKIEELIVAQQKTNILLQLQNKVLQQHQEIITRLVNINAKLMEIVEDNQRRF